MAEDFVPERTALVPLDAPTALSKRERDYILVNIYVRVQHARFGDARTLIDAMLAIGEESAEILLAKAIVESMLGHHEKVLDTVKGLERIEPAEIVKDRRKRERIRVRSFIKARAKFGLTGTLDKDARASLDFYLRQGRGLKSK